jgi:hypothetical protein
MSTEVAAAVMQAVAQGAGTALVSNTCR